MIDLPQPWPPNPWPTRFRTVRASDPVHLAAGLRILTIESPALRGRGELAIHVPVSAQGLADLPIVVLLHGVFGSFWNWSLTGAAHLTLERLIASRRVDPMILAMPSDGMRGEGTGYLPPAAAGAPDFESWIVADVIDCVKEFAPEASDASPIFLGGNSMGGFGAGRLGCLHSSSVAGIALHSAITDLDQLGDFTAGDIAAEAGLAPEDRRLVSYFESCGDATPPLYVDCGSEDPLSEVNRQFHDDLLALGIRHLYEEYPGAHNWDAWTERIGHSLMFFADQTA